MKQLKFNFEYPYCQFRQNLPDSDGFREISKPLDESTQNFHWPKADVESIAELFRDGGSRNTAACSRKYCLPLPICLLQTGLFSKASFESSIQTCWKYEWWWLIFSTSLNGRFEPGPQSMRRLAHSNEPHMPKHDRKFTPQQRKCIAKSMLSMLSSLLSSFMVSCLLSSLSSVFKVWEQNSQTKYLNIILKRSGDCSVDFHRSIQSIDRGNFK